jgi:hypothetical protein
MTSTKAPMTDQAAAVDPRALASEPGIGRLADARAPALPATGQVYLVATADGHDPAFAASLARGLELAGQAGAKVILYDHASESPFVDPFEATGRIPGNARDCLLEPDQLREHGYGHLADQLLAARRQGLDAGAWLVFGIGAKPLARCCAKLGVTRVILPASTARPSLRERLFRHTLAHFTARLPEWNSCWSRLLAVTSRARRSPPSRGRRCPSLGIGPGPG